MATHSFDEKKDLTVAQVDSFSEEKLGDDEPIDLDSVIEGSEGVTQRDLQTYRLVSDRLPYAAFLVVIVEFAERWSYYGTTNIFNNYIRAKMPRFSTTGAVAAIDKLEGVAGALGKGTKISHALRTFNTFWVYVTPFLGAILADTMWGRYKTILIFSFVCLAGHIILVGSASPASLKHPDAALGLLALAIVIMGVGAGSIKANVSPMIAEQYKGKLRKKVLPSGETVVVSPEVTIQSIYLWFYAAINVGACGAISASFLARDHGFWIAFLVPTILFVLVPVFLVFGRKHYVVTPPRGSILLECWRVVSFALGPRWSWNPFTTIKAIRRDDFWDPAKPSFFASGKLPSAITWDEEFVGEVARTLNACAVFLFFPFFWLCYSQIDGNLGTLAAGMTLNGTPNDLIQNLNPISIIVMIPIFDYFIYPFLRKRGINFSPLKRVAAGFIVAGIAMLYAGVLVHFVYKSDPCHQNTPSECFDADERQLHSPLNVWIVSGPYILVGMSEIFASITSLEYAYTKAPERMKSVVMAFSQFQVAIASAINMALVDVNTEPRFAWIFGAFGITAWVVGFLFYLTFRSLDKKEVLLNAIGKGQRGGFAGEDKKETEQQSL